MLQHRDRMCIMCFMLFGCIQEDQLFACPECDIALPFKALKAHLVRIHSAAQFSCSFCAKSFQSRFKVQEHERTHTGFFKVCISLLRIDAAPIGNWSMWPAVANCTLTRHVCSSQVIDLSNVKTVLRVSRLRSI